MRTEERPTAPPPRTSTAPALASVWTTLAGVRCHGLVSMRCAPDGRPDVVLVHGFAVSSRYMVPTARSLTGRFPVFSPDLPGYGQSEESRKVLSVPNLADLLATWLDRRGIRNAVIVGNSFGCQIIADLAIRRPDLVSHLVMIGPTADASARNPLQLFVRLMRDLLREPLKLVWLQGIDYLRFGPRWQLVTLRHMLRDRIEDKMPLLQMPVLVLRGEHDPIAPQRWIAELAARAPYSQVSVVAGAGHAVNYSHPDALVTLIEEFIEERGSEQA